MMNKIKRYAPPGYNIKKELTFFLLTYCFCIGIALFSFIIRLDSAISSIRYYIEEGNAVVDEGYKIKIFNIVFSEESFKEAFMPFIVPLLICLIFIALHYMYHYQGSKSIYTMRRLPRKSELHIKCLAIPLAEIVLTFITFVLLFNIFFCIYKSIIPAECLAENLTRDYFWWVLILFD